MWRPSVKDEVNLELGFHVEMRTRELIEQGRSESSARVEALARFGDVSKVEAICRDIGMKRERDMRRTAYWAEFRQDIHYATRQLRHAPGFTAIAVLTLALGIGATTAIFSLVDAVVLRSFPWANPDRVMLLAERWNDLDSGVSAGNYVDWNASSDSFERMAAIDWSNFNLMEGDTPERVLGAAITHDYFSVFGVRPVIGRFFVQEEDQSGRDAVVVLSHDLWMSRFAGDRGVLGRDIRLSDRSYRVIGVAPKGFDPMAVGERLWVPIAFTPERQAMHDEHYLTVAGLLKEGIGLDAAQADLDRVAAELRERFPMENAGRGIRAMPLGEFIIGNLRPRLLTLLAAVSLVLLIGCANVANLLLARGAARGSELAIRASLGANRGRVVRQLLTESLVLAMLTAAVGVLLAHFAVRLLVAASPDGVPRIQEAGIDGVALLFAVGLATASAVLFGLAPALRASRLNVQDTLREGTRGAGTARVRDRLRWGLIAAEVALAFTLLVGAGLLIRSAIVVARVNPGIDPAGLMTARVTLSPTAYREGEPVRLAFTRMAEVLGSAPGVTAAALVSQAPMGGGGNSNGLIPEELPEDPELAIDARLRIITNGYFSVTGIPLTRGRDFGTMDDAGAAKVMIISETLARRAYPDQDPIGKRIRCCEGGDARLKTVVGVARDVRSNGPAQDFYPEFYLPIAQAPVESFDWIQQTMTLVARGAVGAEGAVVEAMRSAVREVDPTVPLHTIASMREQIRLSTAPARFNTMLLAALGAIGLILAAVGIASVIAYFVSLRTQEIGVRIALGASRASVLLLVARQALGAVALGMLAGIGLSLASAQLIQASLEGILVGIVPNDALTFVTVVAVFIAAAALAAYIPARRATRVQPAQALRAG